MSSIDFKIAIEILDTLPNPVLVKNQNLEYVWVNSAFESLFNVDRDQVVGNLDKQLFPDRQAAQCNGGDLRVLESGEIDEAIETVFDPSGLPRETITRKSRLEISTGDTYLVGVMHDITDVTRANEALKSSELKLQDQAQKLAVLATTDLLTGCANRRALYERAPEILENQFTSTAVLLMDLDRFKLINDELGHEAGDLTLKHFVNEVQQKLSPEDKMYRIGGEEFVILLPDVSLSEATEKANSIRLHIANTPVQYNDSFINITVSTGLVLKAKKQSDNIENLLQQADACLYLAKDLGRNRVEVVA